MTDPERDEMRAAIVTLAKETAAQWRFIGWSLSATSPTRSDDAYVRAIATDAIAVAFKPSDTDTEPKP